MLSASKSAFAGRFAVRAVARKAAARAQVVGVVAQKKMWFPVRRVASFMLSTSGLWQSHSYSLVTG